MIVFTFHFSIQSRKTLAKTLLNFILKRKTCFLEIKLN